jgi:hypothetical protein
MLASGMKCYRLELMLPSGANFIIWDEMLSSNGWLCTFTVLQQLEIPSARSWVAPVRKIGTVRQGRRYGPSITVQITPARSQSAR